MALQKPVRILKMPAHMEDTQSDGPEHKLSTTIAL